MSYIFKYHPDNTIYRNGEYIGTLEEFLNDNDNFPIIENQFFEFKENGDFVTINNEGHEIEVDKNSFTDLINAIESLD